MGNPNTAYDKCTPYTDLITFGTGDDLVSKLDKIIRRTDVAPHFRCLSGETIWSHFQNSLDLQGKPCPKYFADNITCSLEKEGVTANTKYVKYLFIGVQIAYVQEAMAKQAQAASKQSQDLSVKNESTPIPLLNIPEPILKKVIDYCERHKDDAEPVEGTDTPDISPDDADFCQVDQGTLFDMILAARDMNIDGLLDLTCRTVANMIKGKTALEIRQTFNIVDDFTPEEAAQVKKENEWCEEK